MLSQCMIHLQAVIRVIPHTARALRPPIKPHALPRVTKVAMAEEARQAGGPSWHSAYPAPRNTEPGKMTREELLELFKTNGKVAGRDFILVDLRRNDHEGGTIRGSINLPAQSLYSTLPTFYAMLRAAGVPKVIWYCSSSRGRGARAAGWLKDHIDDSGDSDAMESVILYEGIKGWAQGGREYVEWMDEYDGAFWCTA